MNKYLLILIFLLPASVMTQIEPLDLDNNGYINISNLDHLRWISENPESWDKDFELDSDIDASSTKYWNIGNHDLDSRTPDSAMGFLPIGNSVLPFSGSFLGKGHKIIGLYIKRPRESYIGLFGKIYGYNLIFDNIILEDFDITGNSVVGLFCGSISSRDSLGTMSHIITSGIINNYSSSGGLTGSVSNMKIIDCKSSVKITAIGGNIGGFIGGIGNSQVIKCSSQGEVRGQNHIGGFVGSFYLGTIQDCYSSTNSFGHRYVGGFIGYVISGTIKNCYQRGKSGGSYYEDNYGKGGPFISMFDEGKSNNCYYLSEHSGVWAVGAISRTEDEMKNPDTYVNWDFDNIWYISPLINDGFPFHKESINSTKKDTKPLEIITFPNPVIETFNLSIRNPDISNISFKVIDLNGLILHPKYEINNFNGNFQIKIDVSKLSYGIYFINLEFNKTSELIKFIKN